MSKKSKASPPQLSKAPAVAELESTSKTKQDKQQQTSVDSFFKMVPRPYVNTERKKGKAEKTEVD